MIIMTINIKVINCAREYFIKKLNEIKNIIISFDKNNSINYKI